MMDLLFSTVLAPVKVRKDSVAYLSSLHPFFSPPFLLLAPFVVMRFSICGNNLEVYKTSTFKIGVRVAGQTTLCGFERIHGQDRQRVRNQYR